MMAKAGMDRFPSAAVNRGKFGTGQETARSIFGSTLCRRLTGQTKSFGSVHGCRAADSLRPGDPKPVHFQAWNDLPEAIRKAMLAVVEVRNTSRETPGICEAGLIPGKACLTNVADW